jgi:hypothetical protein
MTGDAWIRISYWMACGLLVGGIIGLLWVWLL